MKKIVNFIKRIFSKFRQSKPVGEMPVEILAKIDILNVATSQMLSVLENEYEQYEIARVFNTIPEDIYNQRIEDIRNRITYMKNNYSNQLRELGVQF